LYEYYPGGSILKQTRVEDGKAVVEKAFTKRNPDWGWEVREGAITEAERWLLNHVMLYGSDGYPIQRVKTGWIWGTDAVKGPPVVFKTRREAVASFEAWREAKEDAKREKMGQMIREGRWNPKRNPASAADLYEEFHGRPPSEVLEYHDELQDHDELSAVGDLIELKVATMSGLDATISFEADPPKLASSPDGRQLYFQGGNQELRLADLKMGGDKWLKDSMVIGVLYELTYRTEKSFDKFVLSDYEHKLGEESGDQPMLIYDTLNNLLTVSGGQYQIKREGIVN
jgi:hypothetical protein